LASIKTAFSIKSTYSMMSMGATEVRKVQALQGERSLTIVLPKEFAVLLGIVKGDFLKVRLEDNKIVLEKADI
jgi:hypothetical protein